MEHALIERSKKQNQSDEQRYQNRLKSNANKNREIDCTPLSKDRNQPLMWPLGCLAVEDFCSDSNPVFQSTENDVRVQAIINGRTPQACLWE